MPELHPSFDKFSIYYESAVEQIVDNLYVLDNLTAQDFLLERPEADAYHKVCAMLLVSPCRMLGEALTSGFEGGPTSFNCDDLRKRRTEPLFTHASRQLFPLERSMLEGAGPYYQPASEKALTHEQIQRIHDSAEDILFRCGDEPRSASQVAADHRSLKEGRDHLANNLRQHLIDLPEWDLVCLVELSADCDPKVSTITRSAHPDFATIRFACKLHPRDSS